MKGKRKHLLTIQSKTREASDFDDVPEEWSELAKAWCAIRPMRGEEIIQAQQVHGKVTHALETGWIPGVTNQMRLLHGDRTFNIVSAINVMERNKTLEMMCVEVF